jgi:hypothetical protein
MFGVWISLAVEGQRQNAGRRHLPQAGISQATYFNWKNLWSAPDRQALFRY